MVLAKAHIEGLALSDSLVIEGNSLASLGGDWRNDLRSFPVRKREGPERIEQPFLIIVSSSHAA